MTQTVIVSDGLASGGVEVEVQILEWLLVHWGGSEIFMAEFFVLLYQLKIVGLSISIKS